MTLYVVTKGMSKYILLYEFSVQSNIAIINSHHHLLHLQE